jgi:hypothetical protein
MTYLGAEPDFDTFGLRKLAQRLLSSAHDVEVELDRLCLARLPGSRKEQKTPEIPILTRYLARPAPTGIARRRHAAQRAAEGPGCHLGPLIEQGEEEGHPGEVLDAHYEGDVSAPSSDEYYSAKEDTSITASTVKNVLDITGVPDAFAVFIESQRIMQHYMTLLTLHLYNTNQKFKDNVQVRLFMQSVTSTVPTPLAFNTQNPDVQRFRREAALLLLNSLEEAPLRKFFP